MIISERTRKNWAVENINEKLKDSAERLLIIKNGTQCDIDYPGRSYGCLTGNGYKYDLPEPSRYNYHRFCSSLYRHCVLVPDAFPAAYNACARFIDLPSASGFSELFALWLLRKTFAAHVIFGGGVDTVRDELSGHI